MSDHRGTAALPVHWLSRQILICQGYVGLIANEVLKKPCGLQRKCYPLFTASAMVCPILARMLAAAEV